ncbi:phosphatase PAP2 family protein [bacterium]|nr:phosphatase PAP2 family protein [bacterium]
MNFRTQLKELDYRWTTKIRIADRRGKLRSYAAALAYSGDSWLLPPVFALLWIFGNEYWAYRGKVLLLSTLAVGGLVQIIKWSVRRKRPAGEWGNLVRKTDPYSFPSGHAAKAGLLLGLGLYLGPEYIRIGVCIYSPLMAFARTQMGIHYLSDVIAGFGLGILSSIIIILNFI